MITQLYAIFQKNLMRLMRSKVSAAMILIGPLLLIGLVGFALSNNTLHDVSVGVYTAQESPEAEGFIARLEETDFSVIMFDSEEECIQSVTQGQTNVCIVIPRAAQSQAQPQDEESRITFYVDYSRINLVYALLNVLFAKVKDQSNQISYQMTEQLLTHIRQTGTSLEENKGILDKLSSDSQMMEGNLQTLSTNLSFLTFSFNSGIDYPSLIDTTENNA
ncbi:hypothetical protein COY95_01540, partial [Candidatus Woesearchaeota archaeon CG_4_10_14_0_8_um_filter_47_5]